MTVAVVPLIVPADASLNVCNPVDAVNVVAAFEKLPAMLNWAAPVSFHTAPAFSVTSLLNVFVPVLASVRVPVTEVVPVTVKVHVLVAPVVNVVPVPISRFPPMENAAAVVAVAVPLRVKLPAIPPRPVSVFAFAPLSVRF